MVRPKKKDSEKRIKKKMMYLTEEESQMLSEYAEKLGIDQTKCVLEALHEWFEKQERRQKAED